MSSPIVQLDTGLSMGEKCSRLVSRMRDPEWRKYWGIVMGGKMLGMALILALILAIPTLSTVLPKLFHSAVAHAQTVPVDPLTTQPAMKSDVAIAAANTINPLNTVWTLVAAFLVFGMQAGFTMLEAGFCRSRETVNVLVECVFDTCLCGFLFYAWGYAFMFGAGNGFIGWHDPNDAAKSWFFLQNGAATSLYWATGVPVLAHWIFQFAFADCASTICSGTMIGRTGFWGDIIYSVGVSGFIYPIIGHWAWGPDGFLYTMGGQNASTSSFTHLFPGLGMYFHDFAGSTVVHSIGGWIALAGGIVLGPRIGRKFKRDGGGPMLPHDLVMGVIGGFILWFGWYGFNPGSTLSAMDFIGTGRIAANTTLAACTGGLSAIFFVYVRSKKWDAGAITNGFLAGLVAITCPCYWVSPTGACWIGAVGGVLVILATDLLEYLRIDDPIGAWPVHAVNGVWGTLSLGLFGCGEYNISGSGPTAPAIFDPNATPGIGSDPAQFYTGLFYGNHDWHALAAQAIGSFTVCAATFICAMVLFGALNAMGILRISKEGEIEGMDIHEHGISAYPEYVISSTGAPAGMPHENVNIRG